jgi:serine/threonine-protein kinase
MIPAGTIIGGLRIDALLGRGAMGEVYRGEQLALKRPVAIKRIADHIMAQDQAVARFQREAQCLARVQSPHVVAVYDFGHMRAADGSGHWLLVMELVDGGHSLRTVIGGALPWDAATAFALHIAHGLAAAAELGIIHRDVKPDNVIVSRRGVAKLLDFGLARAVDSTDMTVGGSLIGTPTYMSPEACRGEGVDGRADIYSLGATWYHLIAGRPPFAASNTPAMLLRHLDDPVPPLQDLAPLVPAKVAALVHRCLAKSREDRPETAAVLVAEITALAADGIVLPAVVPIAEGAKAGDEAATAPTKLVAPGAISVTTTADSAATAPTLPMPGTASTATLVTPPAPSVPPVPPVPPGPATAPGPVVAPGPAGIRPRRGRTLVWIAVVLAVPVLVALVLLLRDPFPAARIAVENACKTGDYALALRMADAQIAKFPTRAEPLQLEGEVIAGEVGRKIAEESFDQARALLAERRQGREWFDGEPLAIAIDLAQAEKTAKDGDRDGAIRRFTDLRAQHPKNLGICLPLIQSLGINDAEEVVMRAALDLGEAAAQSPDQTSPPTIALDALVIVHQRWNPETDTAKRVRAVLIHWRPQVVDDAHTAIGTGTKDDPDPRIGAYLLLKEAGKLGAEEEFRYHVRNVVELESRFSTADDSLTWLTAAVAAPDWPARKAAAKIAPFADVEELHHTGDREVQVAKLLLQGFVPEISDALPRWIAMTDEEHEDLRFNAWRLLHDAGLANHFDDFAFHATTLKTFDPFNDSPQLEAALGYFGNLGKNPDGTHSLAAIRDALTAGEQHVEAVAQMVDRNMPGRRGADMREIGKLITAVRVALPAGP